MENKKINKDDYVYIDLKSIFRMLWKKIWIIALATVIGALAGLTYATVFIQPTYDTSILLYVNNNSVSLGGTSFSITNSEITAASGLAKTYLVILNSKTTLESIAQKSGLDYSYKKIGKMISGSNEDGTIIMNVNVNSETPEISQKVAEAVATVLPMRIAEVIDGASVSVVDISESTENAPSITKYTAIGLFTGLLLSVIVISLLAIFDDRIHDDEYIVQNYSIPVLAKVPNLLESGKKYGKYYYSNYYKSNNSEGEAKK